MHIYVYRNCMPISILNKKRSDANIKWVQFSVCNRLFGLFGYSQKPIRSWIFSIRNRFVPINNLHLDCMHARAYKAGTTFFIIWLLVSGQCVGFKRREFFAIVYGYKIATET